MDNFDKGFWEALDKLVQTSEMVIDRPKGSAHPRYPGAIYPLDYGYLSGTASMDGEGIDVWLGTGEPLPDALLCTFDPLKKDSELKLLLGCSETEKAAALRFHTQVLHMNALLVRR